MPIIGTPDQVGAALDRAAELGTLRNPERMRARRLGAGRVEVMADLEVPIPRVSPIRRARHGWFRFETHHEVGAVIVKALAFVGALFVFMMAALFGFMALIRSLIGGPEILALFAALLLSAAVALPVWRRAGRRKQGYGFHWSKCDH